MQPPSRVRAGDPASASWANSLRDWLVSLGMEVRRPLVWTITGSNAVLSIELPDECFARITANNGGGLYSWIEQIRTPAGWVDYSRVGGIKDYAREANDVATIPTNTRVWLRRHEANGQMIFQEDTCA